MSIPHRLDDLPEGAPPGTEPVPRPQPPISRPFRRRASARSRRRPDLRILAGLLIVVLVAGAGAGWEAWAARQHADRLQAQLALDLGAGASDLTAGKAAVSAANSASDPARLQVAQADFSAARERFRAAQQLMDGDPLLRQFGSLPYASSYIAPRRSAVDNLARMGVALADAGDDGAAVDATLIKPAAAGQTAGEKLIATLVAAQPAIPKITADLQRAKTYADRVDIAVVPAGQRAAFARARGQIQGGLDGLSEFNELAPVLLDMLGASGPRTYLVLNVDPAELRGGGGFIGSYILVSADKGDIKLGESKNVYDIDYPYPMPGQKKFVAQPAIMNEFTGHGWVFGDANFSPSFPAGAQAAEQLFKNETGHSVDGVVSIDPWAVAAMLQVTGPIKIPEYSTTVQASTFPDDLVKRLLTEAANVPGKKTYFPVVANHVLTQLMSMPADKWPTLVDALNTSVGQRHLQVYMNRDNVQSVLGRLGWSGTLAAGQGQELMSEVESNFGGNKANYWLTRTYNLDLTVAGGQLQHHLALSLKNATPPGYEGGQQYRAYYRLYCPAAATATSVAGLVKDHYPSDETPPAGLQLMDGWYEMPPMSSYGQVAFSWTTAAPDLATGHAIYWAKQPGTLADKVHVTLKVNGRTFTADTDLGQDRVLVVSADGIKVLPGVSGSIKLPSIG